MLFWIRNYFLVDDLVESGIYRPKKKKSRKKLHRFVTISDSFYELPFTNYFRIFKVHALDYPSDLV